MVTVDLLATSHLTNLGCHSRVNGKPRKSLKRISAASNLFQKDPELRGRKKVCGDGTVVKTSQKSRHVVPQDGEESHRGLANRPGTAESITDICPTSGLKTPRSVLLEGRFHTGALETETGLL